KILMIVGPPRSGKGTIAKVMAALLGPESVVGTGFSTLAGSFGIEPLLGRSVAVLGDARLSGRADQAALVEWLLTTSGEDLVSVNRKNRPHWQGRLPTRLMLLANELPELRDSSLALANRLLIIELTHSFLDEEDVDLMRKLTPEMPGIFHWAVAGWRR